MTDQDSKRPAMRLTNVRLSEVTRNRTAKRAATQGISVAQYVRESVHLRMGVEDTMALYEEAAAAAGIDPAQRLAMRRCVARVWADLARADAGADPSECDDLERRLANEP